MSFFNVILFLYNFLIRKFPYVKGKRIPFTVMVPLFRCSAQFKISNATGNLAYGELGPKRVMSTILKDFVESIPS